MDLQKTLQQYLNVASVTGIDRLHGGMETDVYRFDADGRPLVLRVYTHGDFGGRASTEALVLRRLQALGYPVPEVLAFETDTALLGAPFLIMERIEGQVLWRHYLDRPQEMGPVFVSLLVQLHALDARAVAEELPNTFALDALEEILTTAGMTAPFAPLLAELHRREAQVAMWPPCLIHGDYHPENILMTPAGRPAVIDWGCATLADPRVDVANTFWISFMNNGDLAGARAFQAGYAAISGRTLPDMDYFELLCIARRLIVFLVTLTKGASVVGMKPGIEAELRRQAPAWAPFIRMVEEQSGVALPGVHALLA